MTELDTPEQAGARHAFMTVKLFAEQMLHAPFSAGECDDSRRYLASRQATFTRIVRAMKREAGIEDEPATPNDARASRRAEGG